MEPAVDAAIISFNTKRLTLSTAESFLKSVTKPVTLTVWDNASTDGSVAALEALSLRMPFKVVASDQNLGYGTALNRCLLKGKAKYVLCLNSDLGFPKKGWLEEITAFMDRNPTIGACGPLLLDAKSRINGAGVVGTYKNPNIRFWRQPRNKVEKYINKPKECLSVCGACFVIRRDAFEKIHGFDERFFFYFEETSLCRMLRAFGYQVWYYPTPVKHLHDQSPKKGKSQIYFQQSEKLYKSIWGDDTVISEY